MALLYTNGEKRICRSIGISGNEETERNMIDIHIHIVPEIDDGSRSVEESRYMLLPAADGGTTGMIVTPHCNIRGYFENYNGQELQRTLEAFAELAKETVPQMQIGFGQEVYGTEDAPELIRDGRLLTMNNTRYVLMEFPFDSSFSYMSEILYRTKGYGFLPIVAHPERYDVIQTYPWLVEEWLDEGLGIQVNKGSILGRFGADPYEAVMYLLTHGMVHICASDAHRTNTRTSYMNEVQEALQEEFGRRYARLLLEDNPGRVWNGEPLKLPKDL